MIDPLEQRRFLSASAVLKGNELIVNGTDGDDVIVLQQKQVPQSPLTIDHIFVTVNGASIGEFDSTQVFKIKINALAGNDRVDLSEIFDAKASVDGGGGNDTLVGGDANNTLVGGNGNDQLTGGPLNDLLSGGAGRDKLMGEDGDDDLLGGDGNDGLSGGSGSDHLTGGRGIDTADYSDQTGDVLINIGPIVFPPLWGPIATIIDDSGKQSVPGEKVQEYPNFDPANLAGCGYKEGDQIDSDVEVALGGKGNDIIWSGSGDHTLMGNAGNDSIYAGLGISALYGGDGDDSLYSANQGDAFPGGHPPGSPGYDRVVGGGGHDFAMVDSYDTLLKIEKHQELPSLSS